MGRVPTPGEVATRYTELVDHALADQHLGHPRTTVWPYFGPVGSLEHRRVRAQLVDVVTALHRAHPAVREALATALVDLGRAIAPQPPPEHPAARALRLRRTRNTGPTPRRRRNR